MIRVGLTGGIGSGKSLISQIFAAFSIPVYNSDYETKVLYQTDNHLKQEMINLFGIEVYLNNGSINAKYLGNIVFQNKDKLNQLNSLVHPRVKLHFENWLRHKKECPYIIKESAILFESNAYKHVDKIIVISAPDELRIDRVVKRDSVSRNSVLDRINNQLSQDKIIEKADFVISNDGIKAILPQVYLIHQQLSGLNLA
jgi:dephospho-CoA kinase